MITTDQAVILAAGLGSRLKWLTDERPKALMCIAGVPAIVRVIRQLAAVGVRHIAINVHHHADVLCQSLGNGERWGVQLYFSYETNLLDSGGGVRQAMTYLPDGEHFLLHNADIIANSDLRALQYAHAVASLMLVNNPLHHPQGDFVLHHQAIVARPEQQRLTYSGISCWRKSWLQQWPTSSPFPLTECIHRAIEEGCCHGMKHDGYWFDIGRPADLFHCQRFLHTRQD